MLIAHGIINDEFDSFSAPRFSVIPAKAGIQRERGVLVPRSSPWWHEEFTEYQIATQSIHKNYTDKYLILILKKGGP